MSVNNLTKEGMMNLVKKMKTLQPRQLLIEEYVFQIVDNYFPSKEFPGWLGFRISDGFTKIKCFVSQKNEFISSLQRNREDQLLKYPIIKTKELIDITSSQKGDLEPFVMIKNYEVVFEDIDQIIGCPLSYKIYEERGFRNPQGKSEIPQGDNFDFDELEKNLKSFDEPPQKDNIVNQSKMNLIKKNNQQLMQNKASVIQQQQQQGQQQQAQQQQQSYQAPKIEDGIRLNNMIQGTNNLLLQNQVSKPTNSQQIINQQGNNQQIQYQKMQQNQKDMEVKLESKSHQGNINNHDNQNQFKLNNQPQPKTNLNNQTNTSKIDNNRNTEMNSGYQKQQSQPQHFQLTHQKQMAQQRQATPDCYPIGMLNNMTQHAFKGRVVRLDDVRGFGGKNGKKEGKLFSVHILDENDLIVGTFFDGAVDKWHNKLMLGRCYIFSGAQIKLSRNADQNKQMGAINFDAMFDVNAKIEEIDDDPDIQQNKFNFTSLGLIAKKNRDDIIDTIGIIKFAGLVQEFIPKFKTETMYRRSLIIYDQSLTEIEISLFGNLSQRYEFAVNEIYQFKFFKVSEYNSKRGLQSSFNSSIHDDLQIKESQILAQWRIQAGDELQLKKVGDIETVKGLKTIEQVILDSKICETDKQQKFYSNIRAHLMFVKGSGTIYYQSCSKCFKKAVQEGSGFSCKACQITMDEPKYRFILTVKLVDSTGNLWVTVSDQVAAQLLSTTADTIKQFNDQGKEKEKNEALNENNYREYRFKILSKLEEYNDVQRVKHQVISASQENLVDDTNQYLKQIQFYVDNV